jgi:hypothetical protein
VRDAPPQRPPPLAGRVSARIFVGPLSPLRGESEPTKIRRRTRPSRGKPVRDANPSRQGRGTRSELGRTRPARGGGGLPRPWRDGGLPRPWRDGSAGFPHGLAPLTGPITTLLANLYSRLARLVASTRKHRRYRNKIPIYRNFVTVSKFIRETRRFSPRRGGKSSTLL